MKLRLILRIVVIQKILFKHDLDILLWKLIFSPIYHILRIIPRKSSNDSLGIRVRKALEELGPIFVKFGQAISTRGDIFPREVINELVKLQDQVPPFNPEESISILEDTYKKPIGEVFKEFVREPLAAASVAQVHDAKLKTGEEVVVKILRPGVRKQIEKDLDLLYLLASGIDKYLSLIHI